MNEPHGHPIAELVRTVLSQNTNDTNRDVAYERLREASDVPRVLDRPQLNVLWQRRRERLIEVRSAARIGNRENARPPRAAFVEPPYRSRLHGRAYLFLPKLVEDIAKMDAARVPPSPTLRPAAPAR